MLNKLYWNRLLVYGGLLTIGIVMLTEAVPQYTLLHGLCERWR